MSAGGGRLIDRLKKRREFLAAASGRRFHTPRMTVQGRLRSEDPAGGLRVGFTVTKRVGHATERNRIRRRLRSATLIAAAPHRHDPMDVVVVGRRDALGADHRVLVEDLERALTTLTRAKPSRSLPTQAAASTGDERPRPPHA